MAAVALIGAISLFTVPASAASCIEDKQSGPNKFEIFYELTPSTHARCEDGNDTNFIDASFLVNNVSGWVLADKSDNKPGDISGDQKILFTNKPLSFEDPRDWAINPNAWSIADQIMITLKQSTTFAAFLLEINAISGGWDITGPDTADNEISHASIYYVPTVIPLPAALPLFLTSLGGLGFLGWRRRRSQMQAAA